MKINWKVRFKNPWFWIGLIALFLCVIGVNKSTITSWAILWDRLKEFVSNPYLIISAFIAVIGYIQDPTTAGIGDSRTALNYSCPKKEKVENE